MLLYSFRKSLAMVCAIWSARLGEASEQHGCAVRSGLSKTLSLLRLACRDYLSVGFVNSSARLHVSNRTA
jgi:hypothetical protein